MPAPQDGRTPAYLAAQFNRNAEVKAFFASGQVRPIRVHSEGTRRALRGHSPCAERVRPCVRVCVCSQHLQATPVQSVAAAAKAAADKAAADKAAAAKAAADKAAADQAAADKAAADKSAAKAAADKAAAAKAQQEADDAQLAAALAASLAVSGPVTPPPAPTTLATTRFIESYNQPERIPDQLYALMTTDCHRVPLIATDCYRLPAPSERECSCACCLPMRLPVMRLPVMLPN